MAPVSLFGVCRWGDLGLARLWRGGSIVMSRQNIVNPSPGLLLPVVPPDQAGLCPQRSARLVAVLQAEVDRQRLPGAVVLVARHGKLALFESLGALDPATSTPMVRDAIFRI